MKKTLLFTISIMALSACSISKRAFSLVPDRPSKAPDYFCTWNSQGYAVSFKGGPDPMRSALNETSLFGNGQGEGWINFYPKIREDLYFVMDDSWDIPQDRNQGQGNKYLGLVELDSSRFPSFKGDATERLKSLTQAIKGYGWKGAGGWVCAQESSVDPLHTNPTEYWTKRLKAARSAGFEYWKVDWGMHDRNGEWRKTLSQLGRRHAPKLWIEHALNNDFVTFSDVFRTYDVENITSAPVTIGRVASLLHYSNDKQSKSIINCEDEPYIAVALGCAIGIMRYPYQGDLKDGSQDMVFPPVGRDLKRRMDEIIRAVRWHRIAEPFGVGGVSFVDTTHLVDTWTMGKGESWVDRPLGETLRIETPARVSRGMKLPEITNRDSVNQPFVMASKYPNGAVAVATMGRTKGREYRLIRETVSIELTDLKAPVGIFGDYEQLVLIYPEVIRKANLKVFGQDLASDKAEEITHLVEVKDNKLIIPGEVIRKIGLRAASPDDMSDPGMVVKVM